MYIMFQRKINTLQREDIIRDMMDHINREWYSPEYSFIIHDPLSSDFFSKDKLNTSKICIKEYPTLTSFMLKKKIKGKSSCVSIQKINKTDEKLKNNVDIIFLISPSSIHQNVDQTSRCL